MPTVCESIFPGSDLETPSLLMTDVSNVTLVSLPFFFFLLVSEELCYCLG